MLIPRWGGRGYYYCDAQRSKNEVCRCATSINILTLKRGSTLESQMKYRSWVFCMLLLASAPTLAQSDYAREQRWAEEITPAILVGSPITLELRSGRKFMGIYAPNAKAFAGVIVVHGLGVHPDWGLINPLRSQLAEQGYATLSVQMPVLAADTRAEQYPPLFPEAAERIDAAVAFLRGKGLKKIAVVSHSMG